MKTFLQMLVIFSYIFIFGYFFYNEKPIEDTPVEELVQEYIPANLKDLLYMTLAVNKQPCEQIKRFKRFEDYNTVECENKDSTVTYKIDSKGKASIS